MSCKVTAYPLFERALKRLGKKYRSLGQDYARWLESLRENPWQGADLGRGLRKVRVSIAAKGRGKSEGARVITLVVARLGEGTEVGLLYIYDKSERESLTDGELVEILRRNGLG